MRIWNKRYPYPPHAIYVGRPSPWGNPFIIGKDGTREEVIKLFRKYAIERMESDPSWLSPLKGCEDAVCWCAPEPCHASIVLELANA